MEFEDVDNKIWQKFCNGETWNIWSEKRYKLHIEQLDLGVVYQPVTLYRMFMHPAHPHSIFKQYKIVDEKKWVLAKIKHGL